LCPGGRRGGWGWAEGRSARAWAGECGAEARVGGVGCRARGPRLLDGNLGGEKSGRARGYVKAT
jgi:hypothetical protein